MNKRHPSFKEYELEFNKIKNDFLKKLSNTENICGLDHPEKATLHKKLSKDIKELQSKYRDIF